MNQSSNQSRALVSALVLAFSTHGCGAEPTASATSAVGDGRSYVTGYFALDLYGSSAGLIARLEGGDTEAEPPAQPSRCSTTLCIDAELSPPVSAWLDAYLQGRNEPRSGSIVQYDREGRMVARTYFEAAQIARAEIVPMLSRARGGAVLRLHVTPASLQTGPARGRALTALERVQAILNPRTAFVIRGLPAACSTPELSEAFVIAPPGGRPGDPTAPPTVTLHLRFPNFCDGALDTAESEGHTKNGSLIMLDPTRQKSLLELTVSGLGIFKGTAEASENNSDKIEVVAFSREPVQVSRRSIFRPL